MKHVLTPITIKELPDGWEKNFPFYALSVKPIKAAAAKALLPKDKELHLWEWADFKNGEQARAWGKKMADFCAQFGATRFYINCEAEWAGVEGHPFTATPYQNLIEAVTAFYLHAPAGCNLAYNGFSWARTSDGRKLHDKDLIKLFHAWVPMIYQSGLEALKDENSGFKAKLDKYKIEGQLRIPMLYAGRYDNDGSYKGQKIDDLIELVSISRPDEVAWYFGNGSKSRYFELVGEVAKMNAALDGAAPSRIENKYVVVQGDSWWRIAHKTYGDGNLWKQLRAANGMRKVIHAGDVIVLPSKETIINASA